LELQAKLPRRSGEHLDDPARDLGVSRDFD
jgi:hypothetical protein